MIVTPDVAPKAKTESVSRVVSKPDRAASSADVKTDHLLMAVPELLADGETRRPVEDALLGRERARRRAARLWPRASL